MQAALIAVVATALYYVGVGFFKASAERMEPLQGTRPIHLLVQILTDKVWAKLLEEGGPVTTKPRYPTRHPA